MKKLLIAILAAILTLSLCGCSEAERVNYNITKQAQYFQCERRVTVYNARTDNIVMCIEGYINIETDKNNSELVVTAKVGADAYKKNYVYLNEFTIYVVEDIDGTHTDPYHYKVFFDWKWIDFEVK